MRVLGISAFYHDSAAALVADGAIVAAAQEERFTRRRHDAAFPRNAVASCLAQAGIALRDVDYVAFYDKPFLKFERLLETWLAFAPRGLRSFRAAMPVWMREKLFLRQLLGRELGRIDPRFPARERLLFGEHHLSHAASAFYPSPFERAAILTLDGVGEWATTSLALGRGDAVTILREIHFPHSIGLLYSAFTHYTGFRVNSGEYKVMGLAPYGEPKYAAAILEHLVDLKPDGTFRLDLGYFDYCTGLAMTNERFDRLFGGPARRPDAEPLTQRHMDLAASVQAVTEEVLLRLARSVARETEEENLCLAGGVALNCVANGRILRDGCFRRIWIQPAAGDAGGALGVALAACHGHAGTPREVPSSGDAMQGSFLGPEYAQGEIERRLSACGATFETLDERALLETCAGELAAGRSLGWFQGRMEFGPRALGARSILADPRSPRMQKVLNLQVKHRESFRPFAPSVLREHVAQWFDLDADSPYMLLVAAVAKAKRRDITPEQRALAGLDRLDVVRSDIPAVTHVDFSARIQTVHADTNPRYHALLARFHKLTGCPVLVNTSFNVRGEPPVCTPEDAFRCFMGTGLEVLAVGNCLLRRERQAPALQVDYKDRFEPD